MCYVSTMQSRNANDCCDGPKHAASVSHNPCCCLYLLLCCRAVNYYVMHTLQEWAALPQWLPQVYKAETGKQG